MNTKDIEQGIELLRAALEEQANNSLTDSALFHLTEAAALLKLNRECK